MFTAIAAALKTLATKVAKVAVAPILKGVKTVKGIKSFVKGIKSFSFKKTATGMVEKLKPTKAKIIRQTAKVIKREVLKQAPELRTLNNLYDSIVVQPKEDLIKVIEVKASVLKQLNEGVNTVLEGTKYRNEVSPILEMITKSGDENVLNEYTVKDLKTIEMHLDKAAEESGIDKKVWQDYVESTTKTGTAKKDITDKAKNARESAEKEIEKVIEKNAYEKYIKSYEEKFFDSEGVNEQLDAFEDYMLQEYDLDEDHINNYMYEYDLTRDEAIKRHMFDLITSHRDSYYKDVKFKLRKN